MLRFTFPVPLLAFVLALGASTSADAATYVVNTYDLDAGDTNVGLAGCDANPVVAGDQCTLRAAIMQANATPGADTIVLALDQTVTLTAPTDLDITAPVTITGLQGGMPNDVSRLPRIVAANGQRIFDVAAAGVRFEGLRIEGGDAGGQAGGAIQIGVGSNAVVDRVRFESNIAQNGGAIANLGQLEILQSDFLRNRSVTGGAAIVNYGVLAIRGSSFRLMRDLPSIDPVGMIRSEGGAFLVLENSTIDGTPDPLSPTSTGGLVVYSPSLLAIRNSTFKDFTTNALRIAQGPGSGGAVVANSIFTGSASSDCDVSLAGGATGENIRFGFSLVGSGNCSDYAADDPDNGVSSQAPVLGALTPVPGSVTYHHAPSFASASVDAGQTGADGPLGSDFACTEVDARGTLRPIDGDGVDGAACDMGAIEAALVQPAVYTVNVFAQDLPDADLLDQRCDVDPVAAGDQCTLRAAVMQANFNYGPDRIEFAPGAPSGEIVLSIPPALEPNAAAGDLDITEAVEIRGPLLFGRPRYTVRQTAGDRLFDIATPIGQTVLVQQLRLTGGNSTGGGGAVRVRGNSDRVNLTRLEIFDNEAFVGGAIDTTQRLVLSRVDLHGNRAIENGGAIRVFGGILLVNTSSIWNNTASAPVDAESSAIHAIDSTVVALFNSTVSGNSGGIFALNGRTDIGSSTLVGNTRHAVRVSQTTSARLDVRGSVLARSNGADCQRFGAVSGSTDSYNLIEDGSCPGATNRVGNPLLAPALARPDETVPRVHFPLPGSPVLDGAPAGTLACTSDDQLGRPRPTDSIPGDGQPAACEIGAVEMTPAELQPKSFLVNVFDEDLIDDTPGDTICDVSPEPGLQCTLRAAVMEANGLPGVQTVSVPLLDANEIANGSGTIVLDIPAQAGPASAAHGDLDITDALVVEGLGSALTRRSVQSSTGARIFNISAPGDDVTIRGLRLSGGQTTGNGGAIRVVNAESVKLERLEISGNSATLGGGGVAVLGAEVEILDSDIHDNETVGAGAGVRNDSVLVITRSSVRDNLDLDATREAVAAGPGSITVLYNSTFARNAGDALRIDGGTLALANTTIADNEQRGIGVTTAAGQALLIANSAIVRNGSVACAVGGAFGITLQTDRYNFAPGVGCGLENGASNLDGATDALIGDLIVAPGRYSAFYLPDQASPLIDAGAPEGEPGITCLAVDQVGDARPFDGDFDGIERCDIGSIERGNIVQSVSIFSSGFENEGGPAQTAMAKRGEVAR